MKRRIAVLCGLVVAGVFAAGGVDAKRYHRAQPVKKTTPVKDLAAEPAKAAPTEVATDPGAAAPPPTSATLPANPPLPPLLAAIFQPGAAAAAPVPVQPAVAAETAAVVGTTVVARDTPLHDLVAKHAAANGVPFPLAHAVIMIESKYSARVAHAGNYGLMQIRAQTARGMGFNGSPMGLLDPDTNLRFGMKYLALAYHMAHGDTCGALMRYQSGVAMTRMSAANRAYCARARGFMGRL